MPQALVDSPMTSSHANETAQLRIARLGKKLQEMQDRAAETGGMSPANIDHFNFLTFHKQFEEMKLETEDDIHLVLRPVGVLRQPGEVVQARIVCVLPENAAEKMAFAGKRGEAVRLATDDEIKAYKEYNLELKRIAEGNLAAERARLAQVQFQAMLGQAANAINVPALAQAEVPPEPTAPLADPQPGDGLESQVSPEGGPAQPPRQTPKPQPGDVERAGGFESKVLELGNDKQVRLLLDAGYVRVDQVAEASPKDLTKIKGIGAKTAAQILVRANQIRAEREAPADDDEGEEE